MRIHVALIATVLILLTALTSLNCGGGEAKAAFERYDSAVSPLLEEEHEVWRRFADLTADAMTYGLSEKVGSYIHSRLIPFTEKMSEQVDAVQPEGKDLTRIHGFLIRYVALRKEFLSAYGEMEELDQRSRVETEPARKRLTELSKIVGERGQTLQPAFEAAPEFGASIQETLGRILATGQDFQQALAGLEQGTLASAVFLEGVDVRVLPWLAETKKEIAAMTATGSGKKLKEAVLAYVDAIESLVQASRSLATARSKIEQQGGPLQARWRNLRAEGDKTLQVYKEEALKYRHRLR